VMEIEAGGNKVDRSGESRYIRRYVLFYFDTKSVIFTQLALVCLVKDLANQETALGAFTPEYISPYFSRLVPLVPLMSRSHQKEYLVPGTFTPIVSAC